MKMSAYSKYLIFHRLQMVAIVAVVILVSINITGNFEISELFDFSFYLLSAFVLVIILYSMKIRAAFNESDKQQERNAKRLFWFDLKKQPIVTASELPMYFALILLLMYGDRMNLTANQTAAVVLTVYSLVILLKTILYALRLNKSI